MADRAIEMFTKNFTVEGKENIEKILELKRESSDVHPVVTAGHLSNLDGPAALKALGRDLNLQMGVDAWHFGFTPQHAMYLGLGKEHFSPVSSEGLFKTGQFDVLIDAAKRGKTPWLAIHPYTDKGGMLKGRIGPVFLAHKLAQEGAPAVIVPTALVLKGGSGTALNGPLDMAKDIANKPEATYKIGEPVELAPVDTDFFEAMLEKRSRGETLTDEERSRYEEISKTLRAQTQRVATAVATLLPEEQRGPYRTERNPADLNEIT